jgi:O-antigen/teichoic acid export membrane protein
VGGRLAAVASRLVKSRSGWALSDQSVLSLGNFLTNLLLARSLPRDEFGQFAFVLAIMQLLNNLHGSFVGFQLTQRGAPAGEGELRRITCASMSITAVLQMAGAVVLTATLWSVEHVNLLLIAIGTLGAWQLQETVRRGLLAKLRYRSAVPGDAICYLGQIVLMWGLARFGKLTVESALLCNLVSSVCALLVQSAQVGLSRFGWVDVAAALRTGWKLGSWLLLANVVGVLVVPIVPWALAYWHGSREVAGFQALATVLGISHPVIFSVLNLIVPSVALAQKSGGIRSAERIMMRYALQGAALLAPFYLVLLIVPEWVLGMLYGRESEYLHLGNELRLFVAFYIMFYVSQVVLAMLNGLGNTSSSFVSQVVTAAASLGVTVPMGARGALWGASWGRLAQGVAGIASALWLWGRCRRDLGPGNSA